MKTTLHLLLATVFFLITNTTFSQVTLVSNNTEITSGLLLPNGNPIFINKEGFLFTTDGTTANLLTTKVTLADTTAGAVFKGLAYFAGRALPNQDIELWATDGTNAGTTRIAELNSSGSSLPRNFFVLNNKLYFTADDGINGRELWTSDGTAANTKLVLNIDGKATSSISDDAEFFVNGSNAFFKATGATSALGLYKLDASGVTLMKSGIGDDIKLGAAIYAAAIGNKIVFTVSSGTILTGSSQLWVTDGTTTGTLLLKDFGIGSAGIFIPQLTLFQNKLFFDGFNIPGSGIELWSTDGTAANTKLFKDLDPAGSSIPILLTSVELNNKLYFTASTTTEGSELWSTDGTAANTTLFKDINPGIGSSAPVPLINVGAIQNLVANGNLTNYNLHQFFTTFKGKFYFSANDGTNGNELWSSDGTSANTKIVKNIAPGAANGLSDTTPSFYTTTGIYFRASEGTTGDEPWVTDGTATGTNLIGDVFTGSEGSNPVYLLIYNKKLYFTGRNSDADTDLYRLNTDLTILPVGLSSFMAAPQQSAVQLKWTTANEINADHFGVERSTDGFHFNQIASIAAKGSNGFGSDYSYADESALHLSSVLYYRLNMVDKDAKSSYSNILKVTLQGNSGFNYSLSPNPVHDRLTINFAGGDFTQATVRIISNNGKPVYEKVIQTLPQSAVQHNVNVAGFASGVYFVQIITDNETKTLKFVKQ